MTQSKRADLQLLMRHAHRSPGMRHIAPAIRVAEAVDVLLFGVGRVYWVVGLLAGQLTEHPIPAGEV